MKNKRLPPTDIGSAILAHCFDDAPPSRKVRGKMIEERVVDCWNTIHYSLAKWMMADKDAFETYILEGLNNYEEL
jgi:hypothetical protein